MNKKKKIFISIALTILVLLLLMLYFPTWTPKPTGENSINVLEKVKINGVDQEIMIRGTDANNPVVIYVHGGPGVSEIPHAKEVQDLLETRFTMVNYDQRGSGKSYQFFQDYSSLSSDILVDDLLALTDYITEHLGKKKVILIGHSFGTYIATLAAQEAPDKYEAYIGIGQVANIPKSEIDGWNYVMEQAQVAENEQDITQLKEVFHSIEQGKAFTPRNLVEKYGGTSRLIDSPDNSFTELTFSSEYNLLDAVRFNIGIMSYQQVLIEEVMSQPLPSLVSKMDLPIYFVMGDYDFMTSSHAAKEFFNGIEADHKQFISYEQSAHYPHYEEKQRFFDWMVETFMDNRPM